MEAITTKTKTPPIYTLTKEKDMTKKELMKKKSQRFTYLEKWNNTERIVIRDGLGHFVDNVNLSSLKKAPRVS